MTLYQNNRSKGLKSYWYNFYLLHARQKYRVYRVIKICIDVTILSLGAAYKDCLLLNELKYKVMLLTKLGLKMLTD